MSRFLGVTSQPTNSNWEYSQPKIENSNISIISGSNTTEQYQLQKKKKMHTQLTKTQLWESNTHGEEKKKWSSFILANFLNKIYFHF